MAIVTVPMIVQPSALASQAAPGFSGQTLNASGYKFAVICRVPKTGNIRKIGFRVNTVTTPTDTDCRIETVSGQFPTGTLFGPNTNGTISSGALSAGAINMATLTSDAAVTVNDLIALVYAPSGTPNVNLSRLTTNTNSNQIPYGAAYTGSWSLFNTGLPIAAIEYTDGSYATTPGLYPVSNVNTHTFNSGSTPDEIGAKFRLPVSQRVSGGWLCIDLDNDTSVVLYDSDGATPLATSTTLTSDGRVSTAGVSPYYFMFPSAVTLQASTYYYLSVKPGASNVSIYSWDMLSAAALDQLPGGQDWHYVSAKDPSGTGSWTAVTTRYPIMGLLIDGIDSGSPVMSRGIFSGGRM